MFYLCLNVKKTYYIYNADQFKGTNKFETVCFI